MSSRIAAVRARQILDSRGNPTVEVEVEVDSGEVGRAAVPSGASTGKFEAVELRDGDPSAWLGKGVGRAVENVRTEIAQALIGLDAAEQRAVDSALIELDGTPNKGRLGANAILGASLATSRAGAAQAGVPLYRWVGGEEAHVLPLPMLNVVNGGAHADNSLDLQEFMIVPGGAETFSEGLQLAVEVFHTLKKLLEDAGISTAVGDEGGFAPDFPSSEDAIERILEAIDRAGHTDRVKVALDPAMSEVYRDGRYTFEGREESSGDLPEFWAGLVERFPIVSIEDGAAEDDWDGLEGAHVEARRSRAARRRRPLRHQRRTARPRDRGGRGERDPRQGEPDRDADRDARRDRARALERVRRRHVAPLRRDRGHDDRRPRGRDERGPDQDRRAVAQRPRREVQPAPADRGGARRQSGLPRVGRRGPGH